MKKILERLFPSLNTFDQKHYGLYLGTVVDNDDPIGQMRIRAKIPNVLGDMESGWVLPCTCPGNKTIPNVGSYVWIEFEEGDPSKPVWMGIFPPNVAR